MLNIAFSPMLRRSDVAKAFGVTEDTVSSSRLLCASASLAADFAFTQSLGEECKRKAPIMFVSGLACDSTKQELTLALPGFEELPQMTKSSWNVFVSQHRMSWVPGSNCDDIRWLRIDFNRPNVPIVTSESAQTLRATCYHAPQIQRFSELAEIGALTAELVAVHWDIDGHPANIRMAMLRRDELLRAKTNVGGHLLCSARHCGNHSQNLCDNNVVDSTSEDTHKFLLTGGCFMKMGATSFASSMASRFVSIKTCLYSCWGSRQTSARQYLRR